MMLLGGRKRLNEYMPGRTFNLGKWGIVANVISCFFVLEGCVIYCFPASLVGVERWAPAENSPSSRGA